MNQFDAAQLAQRLMRDHGLAGWTFGFNRGRRTMGLCRYGPKRIELSIHYVLRNPEDEVRDTVLHEIAHALAGSRAGHGPKWKAMCVRLGATPKRCGDADMPRGRWIASCPGCARVHHRHRRPMKGRTYFCRGCGSERGQLSEWRLRDAVAARAVVSAGRNSLHPDLRDPVGSA